MLSRHNALSRKTLLGQIKMQAEAGAALHRKNQVLRDVLNVLGPDAACTCHAQFCALPIEVDHAIDTIKKELGLETAGPRPVNIFGEEIKVPDKGVNRTVTVEGITLHNVHDRSLCEHRSACTVHAPSDHHMRGMKLHWRGDRGLFERICKHGVGHPDPDQWEYWDESDQEFMGVHGCDGCCMPPKEDDK